MFFNTQFTMVPPAAVGESIFATLPGDTFAEKRASLEAFLKTQPQAECPVQHTFGDGVYVRQAFNPADVLIVGETHKYGHICMITKGKVSIFTEKGVQTLEAGEGFIGQAGDKRIVYAWEDSVFTTVHMTSERNIAKLEMELIGEGV